jgi:excisionase family DNA binding protein
MKVFSHVADVLTVPQVADLLKIGKNSAYELVRAKTIPCFRIGRQLRVSKQSVIDYIARSEAKITKIS